jgi:hypothetical protein
MESRCDYMVAVKGVSKGVKDHSPLGGLDGIEEAG